MMSAGQINSFDFKTGGTPKYLEDFVASKVTYKDLDDPQYHIFEVILTFTAKLGGEINIDRFAKYLLNKVYVVYIISSTIDVYKGIRKHNWIYYLKEIEFRYNNRGLDFDQLVTILINHLLKRFHSEVS